jgi:hypothetical protein
MRKRQFATAINCLDGRVQAPVIIYMKTKYDVDYVDMITEPGPNQILAENNDVVLIESIKNRVAISVEKHNSKIIAIAGHYDCASNPTSEENQKRQISGAKNNIRKWYPNLKIIGLWITKNWIIYEV